MSCGISRVCSRVFQPTIVTKNRWLKRPLNIKEPACGAVSLLTLHLILYVDYLSKAGSKYKQMHLVNVSRCCIKRFQKSLYCFLKNLESFVFVDAISLNKEMRSLQTSPRWRPATPGISGYSMTCRQADFSLAFRN